MCFFFLLTIEKLHTHNVSIVVGLWLSWGGKEPPVRSVKSFSLYEHGLLILIQNDNSVQNINRFVGFGSRILTMSSLSDDWFIGMFKDTYNMFDNKFIIFQRIWDIKHHRLKFWFHFPIVTSYRRHISSVLTKWRSFVLNFAATKWNIQKMADMLTTG